MKESELTCEAKDAIRAYILKIVALPGVFATVISFLLGYSIRDIAAKSAELQASQQLSSAITNALAKSQAAEEKLKQAEDIAARIKNLQNLAQALGQAEELKRNVVEQLSADANFLRYDQPVILVRSESTEALAGWPGSGAVGVRPFDGKNSAFRWIVTRPR